MSSQTPKHRVAVAAIFCLACATVMMAQVKTQVTEHKGKAMQEAKVERGEVVYVVGNDLVVKMENGEIRHLTVPDNARATVNGREYSIKDLQPGMKLERTITTTTQEKTVKTVKTGTGTVVQVMPPNSVIVQFEDNTVQQFKIPKNQKFMIDGKELTAFQLKKGMKITATRITEEPATVVSESRQLTDVAAPPPPPAPPLQGVLLIAEAKPPVPESVATPTTLSEHAPAAEPVVKKLPATGSLIPLIGLLGLLFSGAAFALRLLRRS